MPTAEYRRCSIEGCAKPTVARGLDKGCTVDGCEAKHYGRGLCKPHYKQQPDQREHGKQYDRERRVSDTERQEAERQRNRGRRSYINAWVRRREQNMVIIEAVDPQEVFRRDKHRCQLCRKRTHGVWPEPTCPTVDHIVPVSLGGEHSYKNTQCACLRCNVRKGNRAADEQLRLLG